MTMTVEEAKAWAHSLVDQAFESEGQGIPFVQLEKPVERDYAQEIEAASNSAMIWKLTGEQVLTVRWMQDAGSHFKTITPPVEKEETGGFYYNRPLHGGA